MSCTCIGPERGGGRDRSPKNRTLTRLCCHTCVVIPPTRLLSFKMLEIIKTADGSNTIFNSEVGEHYHSKHGAVQESRHVFIKTGLSYFSENNSAATSVSILEVGFGTGLNFLLSAGY